MPWAIENCHRDGKPYFVGSFGVFKIQPPVLALSTVPLMFNTRHEAREFIELHWGYIRDRDDLKKPPHGWKMPRAVKVEVAISKVKP
jgi:hypothetical protein